jgi:hypothetical protein
MPRFVVKRILAAGFGIALIVILGGGCITWLPFGDRLTALPPPDMKPAFAGSSSELRGGRRLEHVRLDAQGLGQIGIIVSLPEPLPDRKLPLVVVLGGLATGEHNIRHITAIGENAVIGYDWPIKTDMPTGLALLRLVLELHDCVLAIPGQVATVIRWAQGQDWADPSRVSLLGFSLGALAVPAAQHLAAQHDALVGWTVLAYGGRRSARSSRRTQACTRAGLRRCWAV